MSPRACHSVPGVILSFGLVGCSAPITPVEVETSKQPTQCGERLDFIPVNDYEGPFSAVRDFEDAVVLVAGSCTGTHIRVASDGRDLILTAGHCVEALGERISLVFNYELGTEAPLVELEGVVVERSMEPDYALIATRAAPSAPVALGRRISTELAIVQHPSGLPKLVETGTFAGCTEDTLSYADLDTLVGSSGAGVMNVRGELVAVHTFGTCRRDGGVNSGWTARAVARASEIIDASDILY